MTDFFDYFFNIELFVKWVVVVRGLAVGGEGRFGGVEFGGGPEGFGVVEGLVDRGGVVGGVEGFEGGAVGADGFEVGRVQIEV